MKNKSPQSAFEKLVKDPYTSSSSKLLKFVAVALWYEEFSPKLSPFQAPREVALAGYLLDKLTRYHCMPQERKPSVRKKLDVLRDKYTNLSNKAYYSHFNHGQSNHKNRTHKEGGYDKKSRHPVVKDKLAQSWHAQCDFKSEFKALLSLQRRELSELITDVYGELLSSNRNTSDQELAHKMKIWDEISDNPKRSAPSSMID